MTLATSGSVQLSPLQLLEFAFEEVSVRLAPGFKGDRRDARFVLTPSRLNMRVESGISTLAETETYSDYGLKFILHVEPRDPGGAPYEATIAVRGTVRMHQMTDIKDKNDREQRALVNGVSLLYGAVRDMVSTVTSRSAHGQMLLPTLNFSSMATQHSDDVPQAIEKRDTARPKRRTASTKAAV